MVRLCLEYETRAEGVRWCDPFRHCEPTGRANARPMTGSTKQSISPQRKYGLLSRVGMTGPNSCVVPANAGTHNHRRLWLRKVSTNVPNTNGTAWVPAFAGTTQDGCKLSNSRYAFALATRSAPEALHETFRPWRAWGTPGARCTRGLVCTFIGRTHTSNNEYTGITRHSRTQWF